MHGPIFDPGNGKKIFHQIDQPHGIIINIRIQLLLFTFIQLIAAAQKNTRVAGNTGKRRSQIMRDGTEQIRPELFIFRPGRRFSLFPRQDDFLHGKGALSKNRKQKTVFKSPELLFLHMNARNRVNG